MFSRTTIRLTPVLYDRVAKAAETVGYSSPEELVVHAIEKELERLNEDDALVKDQLRGLGYIE